MTPRQPSQGLARPLPMPVRPYEDETTRSYIRRINTANPLHHGELMKVLRRAPRPWVYSLSVWMETQPDTLVLAMPQLGKHRSEPAFRQKLVGRPIRTTHSPACHRCTLTRGAGPYIEIYTTHERVICPAHGLWIGEGVAGFTDQFTVLACPEITTAWHHHKTSSPGTDTHRFAGPSTSPVSSTGAGTTNSNTSPPPWTSTTPWQATTPGMRTAKPSSPRPSTPPWSHSPQSSPHRIGWRTPARPVPTFSSNGSATK